jgi:hypothetical protein
MMYVRMTSALTAAALLTLVVNAQAQPIPPQGELHVTFTTTQVPPVAPMQIGDGKQICKSISSCRHRTIRAIQS